MHELVQSQVEPTHAAPGPHAVPLTHTVPVPVEDTFPSVPALEAHGAVRDEINKLVQNLFLGPQGPRRVVFTSVELGSGCSWMCARVAEGLAPQGRGSVCVVDCNLRGPGLHQQFANENHHGLSDALIGGGPIREYTRRLSSNLWLLSCGASADAGTTLLGSERMRSRLLELRSTFDFVLIDAAPMNAWNDAIVLGGLSDGVVMVLKANSSRRETSRKAVRELQSANVRVLGAVLNQRTFPIPDKLYKRL